MTLKPPSCPSCAYATNTSLLQCILCYIVILCSCSRVQNALWLGYVMRLFLYIVSIFLSKNLQIWLARASRRYIIIIMTFWEKTLCESSVSSERVLTAARPPAPSHHTPSTPADDAASRFRHETFYKHFTTILPAAPNMCLMILRILFVCVCM